MSLLYWLLGLSAPDTIARLAAWRLDAASPVGMPVVIVLAVLAAAVAGLNLLPQNVMRWRMRAALTAVRLAGFALLLVMLCRVELRLTLDRAVRPQVAVLTDTSGSMGLGDVAGKTRLDAARELASGPLAPLADRADLLRYAFAWRLEPEKVSASSSSSSSFSSSIPPPGRQEGSITRTRDEDDRTRPAEGMTRLVDAVADLARHEDGLRAIVLLTDGNDTAGNTGGLVAPLLAARGLPVYPVVFGEPGAPRLTRVRIAAAESYARLGDEVRLAARLTSNAPGEQTVAVRLFEDGRSEPVASRENIRLGKDPVEIAFVVKPARPGLRTYRFALVGSASLPRGNSSSSRFLAAELKLLVLNSRIRVLYLDIPRDERKILGHWLARDPVVDLTTLTLLPKGGWYAQGALLHKNAGDGLPNQEADLDRYDVVILGDIPRSYFRAGGDMAETKMHQLAEFVSRRGGGLITLGGYTVYAAGQYQGSELARILPFAVEATDKTQAPGRFKAVPTPIGLTHPILQLEADAQANRDAWLDLPTLDGCNRVAKATPGATVLAVRELDEAASVIRHSALPVLAVQNVGKGKVLSLAMDTTWRWEMQRPAEGEDYYKRFWGNAVRYLAPDPRISPNAPQILRYQSAAAVGQTITLATRLVDDVYKPVTGADLVVKVTSPSGKATHYYPRDGRDAPGVYEYEIALDEPGTWRVDATHRETTVTEEIAAGESEEELDDPRAKPEAMAQFAQATGGKAFSPDQAAELLKTLEVALGAPYGMAVRQTQTASVALWNLPLTMILFAALVCLDCYLRKRRGMV